MFYFFKKGFAIIRCKPSLLPMMVCKIHIPIYSFMNFPNIPSLLLTSPA